MATIITRAGKGSPLTNNEVDANFDNLNADVDGLQTALDGKQPTGAYLTGNQTITLSGDLTGSGTTAINAQLAANVVGANELNVTGNGTTAQYLRSDGDGSFTWATPTDTNTTYSAGSGIGLAGTTFSVAAGGGLTQDTSGLSHADTSTQASLTALTGANVVSDIDLDTYGHVTAIATRSMTAADLGAITGNQTITLSGDVSGSGTTSIVVTVADDSHNHIIANVDGLQTALDGKLATGAKAADSNLLDGIDSASFLRSDATDSASGTLTFTSTANHYHGHHYFDPWDVDGNHYPHYMQGGNSNGAQVNWRVQNSSNDFDVLLVSAGSDNITWRGNTMWNAANDGSGSGLDADLLDGQHGSYYYSPANAPDPTLTLSGDATGSATFTNLGNATLSVTVADDSHNHIISNVDGLQTALDAKASITYVDTAVANIVDTAPAALNTLNELAAALGDDPNFATTVSTNIGTKANSSVTISAGGGLTGGGNLTANRTISHADTSTQASVDNSGATVIQDVTLDTYGHVTGLASKTLTAADVGAITGNQTITLSGDVSGSGTTSIVVTVADDSHNHIIANVDGLQTALNGKLATGAKAADSELLDGYDYTDFNGVVARWITSSSNASGRLKIKLPFATNSTLMLKFTISQYTGYTQHDYEVAAYLYPTTNQWYLPTAVYTGTGSPDIIVGREADGKAYVSIADGPYTGVIVHSLTIGYNGTAPNAYDQGWVITQDATTPNSVSVDVRTTWSSGNDGSGSGLDADLLDGQEGSYYYPASNPNGYTTNVGDITGVTAGSGISGGGTSGTVTISHADTSSQDSVNNSGATVIQDVTLDTYGHITALGSVTLTAASVGAPSTTGTGASGTWGISITGNAGTITSQANSATITGSVAATANQIVVRDASGDDFRRYGFAAYFNMSHAAATRNGDTVFYSSTDDYIRKNNATGFRSSLNVPTRTGGNASGTWGINITGTAANTSSISSAVGGGYTWTGQQLFQSNQNTTGSNPPLQAYSSSGGAIMSFHRGGQYAVNMGLDSDNVFRLGGWSAAANRLQLDMSGNLTMAGNVTAYSDIRIKKDLEPILNAIEKVQSLTGYTYTRIDSGERHTGLIAQDVQNVLPEAVMDDGNHLSLAYGNMVGLLVEAIKAQQVQIDELKTKLGM